MVSFLKRAADFPVAETLAEQFAPCTIVADPAELKAISAALDGASSVDIDFASWHEAKRDPSALKPRCICFSRRGGRIKTASLRSRRPDLQIFRLEYDVLAMAILRRLSGQKDSIDDLSPKFGAPSALHLIASTPRSGSYWLCELMEINDHGAPTEHLRPDIFKIRDRMPGFQLLRLMRTIWSYGDFDGPFVTKVIHKFVDNGFHGHETRALKRIAERMPVKIIYLYRRNLVAQALSSFAATKTSVWRARNDDERERVGEDYPDFDFERIERFVARAGEQAAALLDTLETISNDPRVQILPVAYEDLDSDTYATLKKVFAFLDRPKLDLADETEHQKVAPDKAALYEKRFRRETRARHRSLVLDFHIGDDSPVWADLEPLGSVGGRAPQSKSGFGGFVAAIKRVLPTGVKERIVNELRAVMMRDIDTADLVARQDALFELLDQRSARLEAEFDSRLTKIENALNDLAQQRSDAGSQPCVASTSYDQDDEHPPTRKSVGGGEPS